MIYRHTGCPREKCFNFTDLIGYIFSSGVSSFLTLYVECS